MKDRITIEGQDGAFGAHIARPMALPAPTVVVLQELFGVNADIRKTCDELAEQGFIAVAPDLFWRQEPGVDLSVTSEPDWQHGLRLYQAYDRDAGATDADDLLDGRALRRRRCGRLSRRRHREVSRRGRRPPRAAADASGRGGRVHFQG